jgi:cytochrome c oxidase subunit 2
MQMKIVVDTPEDYQKWLKDKQTIAQAVKAAATEAAAGIEGSSKDSSAIVKKDTTVVAQAEMK